MTELCCDDPLPVLSADGTNTVNCTNCGALYVLHNEDQAKALRDLAGLMPTLNDPDSDANQVTALFKSLPNDSRVHMVAAYILSTAIKLLSKELAAQAPETRNRMTIAVVFPDGDWNLTFARGDYTNVMEDQRNEARAERDALLKTVARLMEGK